MLRSLLLLSFLQLTWLSFAQDTTGFSEIKSIIKQYEQSLQITGDSNASSQSLKESAGKLLSVFESPRTYVYDDLDSTEADTNLEALGLYMKNLSQDCPWGFETMINYKKMRLHPFELNKSRNCYTAKADVLKYMEIPTVTTTKIDTFRIDSTTTDSVVQLDTIKYQTTKKDTNIEKKYSKLTFYFASPKKNEKGQYEKIKIAAITKFKGPVKYLPLDDLDQFWVDLSDGWKEAFREELQLREVPSKYRLGFIAGVEKIKLKDKDIKTLEPLRRTKSLKYLDIEGLPIQDLSPIAELTDLKELNISKTQVDTLLHLQKLTKLEKLYASGLGISDIRFLSGMTELLELDLSSNKIDSVNALFGMTKLEELNLSLNFISDISFLKNMTSVTELRIRKNEIKSLEPLRRFYNLVLLDCFNTDITTLEPLSGLKKLTYLDCSHTKITSLSPIKNNFYLTTLFCHHTKADNFGIISDFKYLRELDVSTTKINSVEPVMKLEYIKLFRAIDTDIAKGEIQRFKKKHPKCEIWYY